jgi:hypothetical protein
MLMHPLILIWGLEREEAILRDVRGLFIACCNSLLPIVEDATSAEAMALRKGLDLASSLGCNRLLVESDCMEVIEVMKNGGNSLSSAAAIL